MMTVLVGLDNRLYFEEMPEKHRGNFYEKVDPIPVKCNVLAWDDPISRPTRVFEWRGQVARKNGSVLFDFFEEVER